MNLYVELSATLHADIRNIEACNDDLTKAEMFSVYIGNGTSFHVQDFDIDRSHGYRFEMLNEAYVEARKYAGALADHLGCSVRQEFTLPDHLETIIGEVLKQGADATPFVVAAVLRSAYKLELKQKI